METLNIMALTAAEQRRIVEAESAWVDTSFGQLDLSAFPALAPEPPKAAHDDRFARSWADSGLNRSASDLRNFVEDPDTEALTQVGADTGDPGYLREVRERKGETVAQQFKRACPGYLPTNANLDSMVEVMAFNHLPTSQQDADTEELIDRLVSVGAWTVANLTGCYRALDEQGLLQVPAGTARNLTDAERLRVTRLAQLGHADQAISEYLRYALDGEEPTLELINDPDYRQVCDDAVWAVFEDSQNDYYATPERRAYLARYCGGRPLTLMLLQAAWAACQASEAKHERGELLSHYERSQDTAPPSAKDLDNMSDDEVDRLYKASLREYVRSVKAPGVLA
jgi:hypothetical protein